MRTEGLGRLFLRGDYSGRIIPGSLSLQNFHALCTSAIPMPVSARSRKPLTEKEEPTGNGEYFKISALGSETLTGRAHGSGLHPVAVVAAREAAYGRAVTLDAGDPTRAAPFGFTSTAGAETLETWPLLASSTSMRLRSSVIPVAWSKFTLALA